MAVPPFNTTHRLNINFQNQLNNPWQPLPSVQPDPNFLLNSLRQIEEQFPPLDSELVSQMRERFSEKNMNYHEELQKIQKFQEVTQLEFQHWLLDPENQQNAPDLKIIHYKRMEFLQKAEQHLREKCLEQQNHIKK